MTCAKKFLFALSLTFVMIGVSQTLLAEITAPLSVNIPASQGWVKASALELKKGIRYEISTEGKWSPDPSWRNYKHRKYGPWYNPKDEFTQRGDSKTPMAGLPPRGAAQCPANPSGA